MKLAENSLTVAESLRDNYFKNTAGFVAHLREAMRAAAAGKRADPLLQTVDVDDASWSELQGEVVSFMDGGIGEVEISGQVPILLRVGSYSVRTGERRLAEREQFGYYPVILGDLEGGSKERKDFVDVVRITAELLGGLSAMVRNPDLRVLMFHGPLTYLVGAYAGHAPFTEKDVDIFLGQYAQSAKLAGQLKEQFLDEARLELYPLIIPERSDELVRRKLFEPLSWMAFLYRKLVQEARERDPVPIIAGVVERGTLSGFSREVLLPRIFLGLRKRGNEDYFNQMFGRTDLTSPRSLLDRLGYTDTLLLAMLLRPGQASEPWSVDKFGGLRRGRATLPGEGFSTDFDWSPLKPPSPLGFPPVRGCYVHVNETTEPVRVEVFEDLGEDQILEAARRVYLYSRLLPGYGFPVGLDIADKHAHIPAWLTDAYGKLIRHHLGVSLQRGEISDAEMRRILVQAIYVTHRDWLFRPGA
jgi:NurA domain